MQAAQATFKSIKAVVPLLDRVLVQRFKPETVRGFLLLRWQAGRLMFGLICV